ncbi:MAG TPA: FmdB family zinc ribbon protein [Actinoplanes sp.]|nr:FmdB family zinc ribbon protein [Actinoplanes sp.]
MPTYQYSCTECAESIERVQSFSDPALTECPACQGRLRKVYNSVGVVFKGTGFYRTDSRSGSVGAESAKSDGKGESKSAPAATSTSSDAGKSADKAATTSASGSSGSTGSAKPAATSAKA